MSIPLFLATPILVLCAPKSMPTTLIVGEDLGDGRWYGGLKGGWKRENGADDGLRRGGICSCELTYHSGGDRR